MPPQIEGRFWYTEGEGETTYSIQHNQKVEKHIFVMKKKLKLNIKRKTLITSELDSYKTNTCTYIIAKKQDFPKDIFKTNLLAFSFSTFFCKMIHFVSLSSVVNSFICKNFSYTVKETGQKNATTRQCSLSFCCSQNSSIR